MRESETRDRDFGDLLCVLGKDFDRRIVEDSSFSARLPAGVHVIFQLTVSENADPKFRAKAKLFNRWARDLARKQSKQEERCVIVTYRLPAIGQTDLAMSLSRAIITCDSQA